MKSAMAENLCLKADYCIFIVLTDCKGKLIMIDSFPAQVYLV